MLWVLIRNILLLTGNPQYKDSREVRKMIKKNKKINKALSEAVHSKACFLTLFLLYPAIAFYSVGPDQLEKPTDLNLHCLSLSMRICSNNIG